MGLAMRERDHRNGDRELPAAGPPRPRKDGTRAPADVFLGADWVERWVPELEPIELRLYIFLAREAPTRTYHEPGALRAVLDKVSDAEIERRLGALERKGLIEVVRRRGKLHYHFLCRGADGLHRSDPVRPSINEALEFHKTMMEELLQVASADDDDDLRERIFERYPPLRDEYLFSVENESGLPGWKPWMELSLHLMNRFEERYGDLKTEHGEVFKEVSAQLLRLKLEMVEKLTCDVLARREEIFPRRGEGWIAGIPESSFVALPFVRELSRKYRVGAEQIYLNTIEAFQAEGLCIVELDPRGRATDLALPSTTGLAEEEERLVFLHVEEMTTQEIERFEQTLKKIRAAKEKYQRFLLRRGVETLVDLVRRDRVSDIDALMQTIADRTDEAMELVREEGEDERVAVAAPRLEDVIALYDELHGAKVKVKE